MTACKFFYLGIIFMIQPTEIATSNTDKVADDEVTKAYHARDRRAPLSELNELVGVYILDRLLYNLTGKDERTICQIDFIRDAPNGYLSIINILRRYGIVKKFFRTFKSDQPLDLVPGSLFGNSTFSLCTRSNFCNYFPEKFFMSLLRGINCYGIRKMRSCPPSETSTESSAQKPATTTLSEETTTSCPECPKCPATEPPAVCPKQKVCSVRSELYKSLSNTPVEKVVPVYDKLLSECETRLKISLVVSENFRVRLERTAQELVNVKSNQSVWHLLHAIDQKITNLHDSDNMNEGLNTRKLVDKLKDGYDSIKNTFKKYNWTVNDKIDQLISTGLGENGAVESGVDIFLKVASYSRGAQMILWLAGLVVALFWFGFNYKTLRQHKVVGSTALATMMNFQIPPVIEAIKSLTTYRAEVANVTTNFTDSTRTESIKLDQILRKFNSTLRNNVSPIRPTDGNGNGNQEEAEDDNTQSNGVYESVVTRV